jgi:hypothetical protein
MVHFDRSVLHVKIVAEAAAMDDALAALLLRDDGGSELGLLAPMVLLLTIRSILWRSRTGVVHRGTVATVCSTKESYFFPGGSALGWLHLASSPAPSVECRGKVGMLVLLPHLHLKLQPKKPARAVA